MIRPRTAARSPTPAECKLSSVDNLSLFGSRLSFSEAPAQTKNGLPQ
jgi:hypothetical protein